MKKIACAFAGVVLAGCSTSLPLPVADFKDDTEFAKGGTKTFDAMVTITSLSTARTAFRKYFVLYRDEAMNKRRLAQNVGEVNFYSALGAAIAGIAKSQAGAIVGAVGSAGAGVYSERYKLVFQAANYDLAAAAMRCMQTESIALDDKVLQSLTFVRANGSEIAATLEIQNIAVKNFLVVQDRLYKVQSNFELATPDFNRISAIRSSFSDKTNRVPAVAPKEPAAPTKVTSAGRTLAQVTKDDQDYDREKKKYDDEVIAFPQKLADFRAEQLRISEQKPLVEEYRTRMEICSASMTG